MVYPFYIKILPHNDSIAVKLIVYEIEKMPILHILLYNRVFIGGDLNSVSESSILLPSCSTR